MHHGTKRSKSPTRPKLTPTRPIVISKINKSDIGKSDTGKSENFDKTDKSAKPNKQDNLEVPIIASNAKLHTAPTYRQSIAIPAPQKHNSGIAPQKHNSGIAPQKQNLVSEIPTFNPQEFIKQNSVRNTYDICMIKKFIGKKLLIPAKGILLTPKVKDEAKHIKAALLANENQKNIIIHVVCINGTMHIINGYSNYLAIGSISYKDIDTNLNLRNTEIKLIQLPKISNSELRILLEYFA